MVKALFPIGKTQWAKWNEMQRRAFNALREQGKSHDDAVALANSMIDVFEQFEPKPEKTETAKTVPVAEKPAVNHKPRTVKRKQGK